MERLLGTLQQALVPELQALGRTMSLPELNQYLRAWVEHSYHTREHRELKATPQQRWENDPTELRMPDPLRLEAAFLLKTERRVNRTALISLGGKRYLVHDSLVNRKVEVRYHPRRPEAVQIWLEDRFVQEALRYWIPTNAPRAEVTAPEVVKTGLNHAQQLHDKRQDDLGRRSQTVGFANRTAHPTPWTESRLVTVLEKALGRTLETVERDLVHKAWPLCSAVGEVATERTLRRFLVRHGADHHLSVYLERIARSHLKEVIGGV